MYIFWAWWCAQVNAHPYVDNTQTVLYAFTHIIVEKNCQNLSHSSIICHINFLSTHNMINYCTNNSTTHQYLVGSSKAQIMEMHLLDKAIKQVNTPHMHTACMHACTTTQKKIHKKRYQCTQNHTVLLHPTFYSIACRCRSVHACASRTLTC
jgi:hypothetical protein